MQRHSVALLTTDMQVLLSFPDSNPSKTVKMKDKVEQKDICVCIRDLEFHNHKHDSEVRLK